MKPNPSETKGAAGAAADSPFDGETGEEDLWFLPGPPEEEVDFLPPLPRSDPDERAQIAGWEQAQAAEALHLAQAAVRFGALDERLRRGPEGWRHRLALTEASELSWLSGDRISADRLGLWQAMRISAAGEDTAALQHTAWALRRLSGGPGPGADIAGFLGRHEARGDDPLTGRIAGWNAIMKAASSLHPIVRSCFAFHLWPMAGIGPEGDVLEGAVIAARMSAGEGQDGALFAPLLMSGAGGLRGGGAPQERLQRWLQAVDQGILRAMRHLDQLDRWESDARRCIKPLSGRTPPRLIEVFRSWPMVTAPLAEELTGVSRAAVQRNIAWFEAQNLVQEVTGQGRFRVWRAALNAGA
ncbi:MULTISPECIES: helix-turn-helix domain-containing protein [unclassified Leisingera]|uniref:helix-turn-helix domain-containing protein n=1 Tax=unclassified Leisingera TaxID=2614906 RepID=UPI0002E15BF9|nr:MULTISPECIES: helix-turn-helix domain-containing protein [unclassified Leisingera]KIC21381.1 hypothetical protein RA23_20960 [Leisingera sp. ANG-S3]KIC52088.1 hypothetical protein RA22_17830 [Leisingera sp. ANG-S]KID09931.1 hypothetical protein GC1_08220 [Leisingera sp. ANG1]